MPPTPTAWWDFETLTTTGLEADVDTIAGVSLTPTPPNLGRPSVAGKSGEGRLLACYASLTVLDTSNNAALRHLNAGDPVSIAFWWRPLVEAAGPNTSMLLVTFSSTLGGSQAFDISIRSAATLGLYNIVITTPSGTQTFSDVDMDIREWHLIVLTFDGAATATFYVDTVALGTVAASLQAGTTGRLLFQVEVLLSRLVIGVLDLAGVWTADELSPTDIDDIYNGWTP